MRAAKKLDDRLEILVDSSVWTWLVNSGSLHKSNATPLRSGKSMKLDSEACQKLASGVVFGHLLGIQPSLRIQPGAAGRMRNWNVIGEELARYGIALDAEAQQRMASGDSDVLSDALMEIYESFHSTSQAPTRSRPSEPRPQPSHGVYYDHDDEDEEDEDEDISAFFWPNSGKSTQRSVESSSVPNIHRSQPYAAASGGSIELIRVLGASLSAQLGINEDRACEMVAGPQRAQLQEYLQYGRIGQRHGHGQFDGIGEWVRASYVDSARLTFLIGRQPTHLRMLLDVFSPGLLSSDYETALWTARLLGRVVYDVCIDPSLGALAWAWFIEPKGGFYALLQCYSQHQDLLLALWPLLDTIAGPHLLQLFADELPRRMPDPETRLGFLHELMSPMAESALTRSSQVTEGVVKIVLESAMSNADPEQSNDQLRMTALGLLSELWNAFPQQVEALPSASTAVLDLLRKGCRSHSSRSLQLTSLTCLFSMLDSFSSNHSAFAPKVYKTLIFSLIENYEDAFARDYITANLCVTLHLTPRMPVSVLLEPLVKQIAQHGVSNIDFDFFLVLAKHPALQLRHALLFMHLLGKLSVDDISYGRLASVPFLLLVNRFRDESVVHEYVRKFTTVTMSLFLRAVPRGHQEDKEDEQIRQTLTLEIVAKLCHLHHSKLNSLISPLIVSAIQQYREEHGHGHPSLEALDDFLENEKGYDLDEIEDVQLGSDGEDDESEIEFERDEDEVVDEEDEEVDEVAPDVEKSFEDAVEVELKAKEASRTKSKKSKPSPARSRPSRPVKSEPKKSSPSPPKKRETKEKETRLSEKKVRDKKSPKRSKYQSQNAHPPEKPKTSPKRDVKTAPAHTPSPPKEKRPVAKKTSMRSKKLSAPAKPKSTQPSPRELEAIKERDERERARKEKQEKERKQRAELNAKRRAEREKKQMAERIRLERLRADRLAAKKAASSASKKKADVVPTVNKSNQALSSVPIEASIVLACNRRPLLALFRAYRGIRPSTSRFQTFEMISKAMKCMSISDFYKLWEDMRVLPLLLTKPLIGSIFRSCNSGVISSDLLTFNDFLPSVYEIAHTIAIANDDSLLPSEEVASLLHLIQQESVTNDTVNAELWLNVAMPDDMEAAVKAASLVDGGGHHRSNPSHDSRLDAKSPVSRPESRQHGDAVGAAVNVLGEILRDAFGYEVERDDMFATALGVKGRPQRINAAVRSMEAERERKRRRRKEQLAAQLEKQKLQAKQKEKARKEKEQAAKIAAAKERKVRREKLAKEREETKKKLEEYRKRKDMEEKRKRQIEKKKKELEREERRRNIQLYLKQKKEREEIHKRTVDELSKLEPKPEAKPEAKATKREARSKKNKSDVPVNAVKVQSPTNKKDEFEKPVSVKDDAPGDGAEKKPAAEPAATDKAPAANAESGKGEDAAADTAAAAEVAATS